MKHDLSCLEPEAQGDGSRIASSPPVNDDETKIGEQTLASEALGRDHGVTDHKPMTFQPEKRETRSSDFLLKEVYSWSDTPGYPASMHPLKWVLVTRAWTADRTQSIFQRDVEYHLGFSCQFSLMILIVACTRSAWPVQTPSLWDSWSMHPANPELPGPRLASRQPTGSIEKAFAPHLEVHLIHNEYGEAL
ncbi:uncharacterized protein CLUP02_14210 [Colletotrichum lupini]|uniref:Uncharacterized protein n=1 Tax=Colletotrichum lupini TaxID=145971 RepID=A0A9Q8WN30_9PEZI|nr:uncharacterized protein CLUP02_14210 [Colletotrichum lupini]UQC88685.1 hypothetical protein CLUP02_14210 [Colletotrichum lupini]